MKKIFKGLFVSLLSVGFLAGCGGAKHTVEFYEDNLGTFYKEVQVKDGKTVARPADPAARDKHDFDDWYNMDDEDKYTTPFDFSTKITKDMKIYGKWEPKFIPDERVFHVIGDLQNTDLPGIAGQWAAPDENPDPLSILTKAANSNLYTVELEIGFLGKFKVKQPEYGWDAGAEYDFTDIREEDARDYLKEGDTRNVQILKAGAYKIEIETTYNWIRVTRTGDAKEGSGVTPDTAIPDYGLVGSMNAWGEGGSDYEMLLQNDTYVLPAVELKVNDEFKLRADKAWTTSHGWSAKVDVPEGKFEDKGGNINVLVAGYYSIYMKDDAIIIRELAFALRGDGLATGWDTDSAPLTAGEPVVTAESVKITYTGTFDFLAGSVKVKLVNTGVEGFDGWPYSVGAADGSNIAVTAGSKTVTLVLTLALPGYVASGVASIA